MYVALLFVILSYNTIDFQMKRTANNMYNTMFEIEYHFFPSFNETYISICIWHKLNETTKRSILF